VTVALTLLYLDAALVRAHRKQIGTVEYRLQLDGPETRFVTVRRCNCAGYVYSVAGLRAWTIR
jgi:hypothetical protein